MSLFIIRSKTQPVEKKFDNVPCGPERIVTSEKNNPDDVIVMSSEWSQLGPGDSKLIAEGLCLKLGRED